MTTTLEEALSELERRLESAFKSGKVALADLRKAQKSAKVGHVRELIKGLAEARNSAKRFSEEVIAADSSWSFSVETYMLEGSYLKELVSAARVAGLTVVEKDGKVFCFPTTVSIAKDGGSISVGKKIERRLRPREVAKLLLSKQHNPSFKAERFLSTLSKAYDHLAGGQGLKTHDQKSGPLVSFKAIYDLLTLWPGVEYSLDEFAMDIHFLARNPDALTKDGRRFYLANSTGSKDASQRILVVDSDGSEKVYVSIRFAKEQ